MIRKLGVGRRFRYFILGSAFLSAISSQCLEAVTVSVGSVTGVCGSQVSIPVSIDNAAGLLALQFRVGFDPAALTASRATTGSLTSGFSIASNASSGLLTVALASGSPASAGGGVVAYLSFSMNPSAPAGVRPLSISAVLANDQSAPGQSGSITIPNCSGATTWLRSWIVPSSARVQGIGAFWTTDLTLRNGDSSLATVLIKFLGHGPDGTQGPERTVYLAPGETQSFADVLMSLFNLSSDYGPVLVRSTVRSLNVLSQTWTPGGGGTYGQAVPGIDTEDLIGSSPRSIVSVRQDSAFRTNLMIANASATTATVDISLMSAAGNQLGAKSLAVGPYSRAQFNVANDFGQSSISNAAFIVSSSTPGAAVAAYASIIDATTGDPRTVLPQ